MGSASPHGLRERAKLWSAAPRGGLLLAPMAIEKVGRMAILADPQGAVFAVIGPEDSAHPS